jgi:uncharacterized protein YdeI (YjbR/CyaY-like superfamily)
MNPKVDAYLNKAKNWQDEMRKLRTIVLDCGLTEELKWYQPCYTFEDGIVLLIGAFKEYCTLAFFKGALLKDVTAILVSPGKNSQAVRQIRFTSVQEIVELEPALKAYINEAIEMEKAGLKVKKNPNVAVPEEFQSKLNENPALKAAFAALTPGRRRAYLMHFSQPKQSKTRAARVEKCTTQILDGKGLDDDYRSMRK